MKAVSPEVVLTDNPLQKAKILQGYFDTMLLRSLSSVHAQRRPQDADLVVTWYTEPRARCARWNILRAVASGRTPIYYLSYTK